MKICDILKDEDNENLLKKWLEFREEDLCHMDEDDKRYLINFDDYSQKILNNVTGESYKYYMTGFSDAIRLLAATLKL